jgi:hypothetical protein
VDTLPLGLDFRELRQCELRRIVESGCGTHAHGAHTDHAAMTGWATVLADLAAVGLHTLALFAVMGVIAVVVYEKLGVLILKRTWFNLDLLWAGALVEADLITLVV